MTKDDPTFDMFGEPLRRNTRFIKGQSGNPKGRPKKKPPLNPVPGSSVILEIDMSALEFGNRELVLRNGDQIQRITGSEAAFQTLVKSALGGNVHALKELLRRLEAAQALQYEHRKKDATFWLDYKTRAKKRLEERRSINSEPVALDAVLPHPDDIIIDKDHNVRIEGPINAVEFANCLDTLRVREALIWQNALDIRCASDDTAIVEYEGHTASESGGALLLAHLLDRSLPTRMKLSEMDWITEMMQAERISKRILLKIVKTKWDEAARISSFKRSKWNNKANNLRNSKRGRLFPSTRQVIAFIEDSAIELKRLKIQSEPVTTTDTADLAVIMFTFINAYRDTEPSK